MDEELFKQIEQIYNASVDSIGNWSSEHALPILGIIAIAWLCKKFGTQLVMRVLQKTVRPDLYPTKTDRIKRLKTLESLIKAVLGVAIFVVAGIMIVAELGLNTTPMVASAGIIGVALGFGAQSLIKDLTSGLFIIIENQYRVDDVIALDNGVSGKVEAITIRTTVIRSLDGTLFHVPNGSISWTANKTTSYGGIEEDIIFDSGSDIKQIESVINKTGLKLAADPEMKKKIKEPPQFLRVDGFDANGIRVKIIGKTTSDDSWEVKGAFYKLLIEELRKEKIKIPYMHVTLTQDTPPQVTSTRRLASSRKK